MNRWNRMQAGPRTGVGAGARSLQRRNFYAVIYSDGRVGCFGSGFLSALEPPPEHAPTKVLAASDDHIVTLRRDGRVVCWGQNEDGQCDVPADLGPCKAVAAGHYHTAALTEDGRVVCWGFNNLGQCDVPADFGPCKAVAAGCSHTAAVTEDGRLHVWGVFKLDEPLPTELTATMTDDAWPDFAVREYPRCHEAVFPARIRALPQFETIRAMHRLAGG